MSLPLNRENPFIMHIDLNSCFATIEQQAYPSLRNKPLVIAAYISPGGCILAPSIEAKRLGIKTGMTVRDARLIYKDVIVRNPDPQMVRQVHILFKKIVSRYSPLVSPKSIDELVIDFTGTHALKRNLSEIAMEIKSSMKKEIGEWIVCNIGISTNRFLAKLAASLHKPDGLDIINHKNIINTYKKVNLKDLNGINTGFEARLNSNDIFSPLDFLNAPLNMLWHQVFKSILGYYWYLKLRGWETDAIDFKRKSFGQSYALKNKTDNPKELAKITMKLCEKMGRRLRKHNLKSYGIHLSIVYTDFTYWHKGITFRNSLYTINDLFTKALWIFNLQPQIKNVKEIAVSCFALSPTQPEQLELLDVSEKNSRINVQNAVDKINDKWGEFVMTPALMMGMKDMVIDRIAFGGSNEIEDIYTVK